MARMNPRSQWNARWTGYGIVQPGAHPETNVTPQKSPHPLGVALSNSFRTIKRAAGLEVPDTTGIEAQVAEKKAINRYLQSRGGRI